MLKHLFKNFNLIMIYTIHPWSSKHGQFIYFDGHLKDSNIYYICFIDWTTVHIHSYIYTTSDGCTMMLRIHRQIT